MPNGASSTRLRNRFSLSCRAAFARARSMASATRCAASVSRRASLSLNSRSVVDPVWSTPIRRSPTFSGAPTSDLTRSRRMGLITAIVARSSMTRARSLTVHLAPAADVAKHQDDSRHRSVRGPDGSGAVVHWNLAAVFRDQHGVIGQAGDDILAHDLADRAVGRPPRFFVDDHEDFLQAPAERFHLLPS